MKKTKLSKCKNSFRRKYWEGFDSAVDLVINNIRNGGFFISDEIANQFADEILEEIERYKKGD